MVVSECSKKHFWEKASVYTSAQILSIAAVLRDDRDSLRRHSRYIYEYFFQLCGLLFKLSGLGGLRPRWANGYRFDR